MMRSVITADQRIEALVGPPQFTAFNRTAALTKLVPTPNGSSILCAAGYILPGTMNLGYRFITALSMESASSFLISLETAAAGQEHIRVRIQNETGTQQNQSTIVYTGIRSRPGIHTAVFYLAAGHTNLKLWVDDQFSNVAVNPGVGGSIQADRIRINGGDPEVPRASAAWAYGRPEPTIAQVRAMQGWMARTTKK